MKHDAIVRLKELALELGRTPSRREFEREKNGRNLIDAFGGFTQMCHAAGLDMSKKIKITNEIFERDIERHLEEYRSSVVPQGLPTPWPKIACLPDLHEPWGHDGVKADFKLFCEKHKPDYIVQLGDSVDYFSHAKFPKSHNVFTPKQEEETARKHLEELWSSLHKAAPKAKLIGLMGNHNMRGLKRILEVAPSLEHWATRYMEEYFSFPNVEMIMDPRAEYEISDITFIHGYRSKLGDHRNHLMRNVVCGHSHSPGVVFRSFRETGADSSKFELNCGVAADVNAVGLSYTSTKTTGWGLGFGYIDSYGPRFVPYRG